LASVGLAEANSGDLRDGVPLIGRFKGTGQQGLLFQRLRRQLGINAGAA